MKKLSIIVPCYNEEKNVGLFYDEVKEAFKEQKINLELVFVNDGSKDNTIGELKKIIDKKGIATKVVNFSRNFGKEAAMYAGLKNASGDYCVIIDADLQQPPSLIIPMLDKIREDENIDMVTYFQDRRNEGKVLSFFKKSFYSIINKISDVEFVNAASDFRLLSRKVVDSILELKEKDRFSKGIFSWVGYNVVYLPYVAKERANGKSSWNFFKLFKYAMSGIFSFSSFILKIPLFLGLVFIFGSAVSFFVMLLLLIFNVAISKLALFITIIVFIKGFENLFLGFIGVYLQRVYSEVRNRPIYIAKEVLSNEKDV